jgi:hypothetical protein
VNWPTGNKPANTATRELVESRRSGRSVARAKPLECALNRFGMRSWCATECASEFTVVHHERMLALIQLLGNRTPGRVHQAQCSNDPARRDLDTHAIARSLANQVGELAGGDRGSTRYVPYLTERCVLLAQDNQRASEIADERIRVELIGIAQHLRRLVPRHSAEDTFGPRSKDARRDRRSRTSVLWLPEGFRSDGPPAAYSRALRANAHSGLWPRAASPPSAGGQPAHTRTGCPRRPVVPL